MPLSAGEKLGPYEILAPLGAGGMGEVYRTNPNHATAKLSVVSGWEVFSIYGREFTDSDVQSDAQVAVVSDLLAREFGDPAAMVGHQLLAGPTPITIIGVVKDLVYIGDANSTEIYVPDHAPGRYFTTIVARVSDRPENRLAMVRDAVRSVDPQVPVYDVKTMDQLLDSKLGFHRLRSHSLAPRHHSKSASRPRCSRRR